MLMNTFTGKRFDLNNPAEDKVDLMDMAQSLSMLCRFGGHIGAYYSVAEHSLLSEQLARMQIRGIKCVGSLSINLWLLKILIHDAHEMYTGDIIKPLKLYLNDNGNGVLHQLQRDLQDTICTSLGLPHDSEMPSEYKELEHTIDMRLLFTEAEKFEVDSMDWYDADKWEPYENVTFACMAPQVARYQFLNRYNELIKPILAAKERGENVPIINGTVAANA